MTPERFARVHELFLSIVDLPHDQQEQALLSLVGDDAPLVDELRQLLREDAEPVEILGHDVAELAAGLLQESEKDRLADRFVGPYRLRRLVGEGGMGVVYLAERDDLAQTVAVKILRDAWLSPARRARFLDEQKLLAQLSHSSIAQIYDAGTLRDDVLRDTKPDDVGLEDGVPWFAMEYVDGEPLTAFARSKALPIPQRLKLLERVAEAIQFAHSRAVLHRDIKPSNVLATADGSIRLLDFGIASRLELDGVASGRTVTGLRMYTPTWAAPEVVRGESVGVQADVYSLGVLLYELLTDELPSVQGNTAAVEAAQAQPHLRGDTAVAPSVVARRNGYPTGKLAASEWADLDVLCLSAMHPDPQRRYASAEALLRDIRHFLSQEPLEARPDSWAYRVSKFVRRNQRLVIAASVALLSILIISGVSAWRVSVARDLAAAEALRAQHVHSFLTGLFDGGDEYAGPAKDLRVTTLLDRGRRDAQAMSDDDPLKADLFESLGGVYQKLGELDDAESLLTESLAHRRSRLGNAHPDVARTEVALGLLRLDQARLEEAETLVQGGISSLRAQLPTAQTALDQAELALGFVYVEEGEYTQAIEMLQALRKRLQPVQQATQDLDRHAALQLANAYFYAGDYDASRKLNLELLDQRKQQFGENHPSVADLLVNLGAIDTEQGNFAEAESRYRQALRSAEVWFGETHPRAASMQTMLGRVLIKAGDLSSASIALEKSYGVQLRTHGENHPAVASALNELGILSLQRKEYPQAESQLLRVAQIYRNIHPKGHYLHGIASSNLGSVASAKEDLSQAERYFRSAISQFTGALEADHLNTGIARLKLGRVLLKQRRLDEARQEIEAGRAIVLKKSGQENAWTKAADEDLAKLNREVAQRR